MQFSREIEIDAPAEKAWEVIGEGFGEISNWILLTKSPVDVLFEELRYRVINGRPHPDACFNKKR